MKPEIIWIEVVLQKALSSKALPASTSQDRLKWLRDLKLLLSLSLRSRQPGTRTNAHKSHQDLHHLKWPQGQRYCFGLLPISCPLKDEMKFSQQGNSKRSRSPKTTGSDQPTTSSVSMFCLRVPTVGASNSRSLCLKTTECPKRVIDLLANSLHSVKGIWKIRQISVDMILIKIN